MAAAWPGRIVAESSLTQAVYKLRTTLGDRGLIVTEPGVGYRFAGPRSPADNPDATPEEPIATAAPVARATKDRSRAFQLGLGFGAVLVAVGGGFVASNPWGHAGVKEPAGTVVLADFQNLTGEALFDKTLATATLIDMRQSPHVTVLSDQQVRDTLGLMMRPKDSPLTPAVAREVCVRNNGQEVIEGGVARFGAKYLLTLTATGCVDGKVIVADKAETTSREALLPALDSLVDRVRRSLGESSASVEKFNVPLASRQTASLDALKAYSEAKWLEHQGRLIESIPLFNRAIDLDPNFAMAYADLGAVSLALHGDGFKEAESKAYALRDRAGEHDKLMIAIRYGLDVQKDQLEGLRALHTMADLYPAEPWPLNTMASREDWIGLYSAAIQDGRKALALGPDTELHYAVLADAYMHAGRLEEARATCARAVALHLDGERIHKVMFEIAFALNDDAGVTREIQWAEGKAGEQVILIDAGQAAASRGQMRLSASLFARALAAGRSAGLGNWIASPYARLLNDMGLAAQARESLKQPPLASTLGDYMIGTAEVGDPARAETLIREALAKSPRDTVLHVETAPLVQATLALRRGKPVEAIAALKGSADYELRDFDVPYLRGQAFLAAGDGAGAAAEFRKILDHRGVRPLSVKYPLARLGLARALRLQGQTQASRADYAQLLAYWKNADPDLPLLRQAKAEYAKL